MQPKFLQNFLKKLFPGGYLGFGIYYLGFVIWDLLFGICYFGFVICNLLVSYRSFG